MAVSAGTPSHSEYPMKPMRLAALSLSLAVAMTACSPSANTTVAGVATTAAAGDAGPRDQVAAQITGAGATFIFPLISKWSADYHTATGNMVNYQSIGSGGGIAQIKAGTVDFGSSDAPLSS